MTLFVLDKIGFPNIAKSQGSGNQFRLIILLKYISLRCS